MFAFKIIHWYDEAGARQCADQYLKMRNVQSGDFHLSAHGFALFFFFPAEMSPIKFRFRQSDSHNGALDTFFRHL